MLSPTGLRTRQIEDGIGVAAVAFGHADGGATAFPAQPFALAVNVRAEFSELSDSVHLVVTDASHRGVFSTAFGDIELARDTSAAYASAAMAFESELGWWEGLRGPSPDLQRPQVRLLAPVDQSKTPVLLIHGLASSPMTWANMVNELQGDPDIAEHFQFWLVRYPTGLPLLHNRQQLATEIENFHQRVFPRLARADRGMVAIGHSMGGVLTRLLATDSGTSLWDAAFLAPPEAINGTEGDIRSARALFEFTRLDGLNEIILIAAPHRGSDRAEGLLARVARRFIGGPGLALDYLARLAQSDPISVHPRLREIYITGGPGSLDTLSPTQPVAMAASGLPVAGGVRVHSIIGIKDPLNPDDGDGVVSLESASWPTGSTVLLTGDHGVHGTPEATAVIKRILLERLQTERD
ncbi:esterase/lipase family protein [Arenimonas aestuarii]